MSIEGVAAGALETSRRFSSALLQNIGDGDLRPRRDHQPCGLRADPACRSGNQRDLAIEPVHFRFPSLPRLMQIASHWFGALCIARVTRIRLRKGEVASERFSKSG